MERKPAARKDALCRPGHYMSIPHEIASRTDLSQADKMVYGAMLDHLRGASTEVFPAASKIATMIGASVRQVHRSQAAMIAKGLLYPRPRRGHSTQHSFAPIEEPCSDLTPDRMAHPTPAILSGDPCHPGRGGMPSCHGTPANVAHVNTHGNLNTNTKDPKDPVLVSSSKPTTDNGSLSAGWLRNQIDNAHRDVFGCGMPAKWTDAINSEVQRGDPRLLMALDAGAIRAGQRLAKDASGTFGFGWVLRFLTDRAAGAAASEAAIAHSAEAETLRIAADTAQRERDAEQEATQRAWFAGQSVDVQRRYRDVIAQSGPFQITDNLRDRLAAAEAWKDAHQGDTPIEVEVVEEIADAKSML